MDSRKDAARRGGNRGNALAVPTPGTPDHGGYAEPTPRETSNPSQPNPDAAGNARAQVAASAGNTRGPAMSGNPRAPAKPGESEEPAMPGTDEPLPPGEHKREPIEDPDPADTKLHVQSGSR
jgi:hypothetical protein